MRFTTMITAFFLAVESVHASPISPGAETLVTLNLFDGSLTCDGAAKTLKLEANLCYSIVGADSLRVIDHKAGLFYNSLRVYRSDKCNTSWTLQPLQDNCSDVRVFKSIMVVT